jgi:hypothetical protein
MPNTTNFNWPTPADTDLVKDGAAAIRNLGNGVDTSLVDLKGGTTGQILSKASNADMDFTFVTPNVGDITEVQAGVGISISSGTGPIPIVTNSSTDLITTAGDLLYGTAADTVARLGIGTAGQVLKVNSGATAPEWGAAASGDLTISQIATGTLSGTSKTLASSLTSYNYLMIFVYGFKTASNANFFLTINNNEIDNYSYIYNLQAGSTVSQTSYTTATDGFILTYWDQSLANDTNNQTVFILQNCKAAGFTTIEKTGRYVISGPTNIHEDGAGIFQKAEAVSSVEIKAGATMTGGTYYVFGG